MATIRNLTITAEARQQRKLSQLDAAQVHTQQIKTNPEIGGVVTSAGAISSGGGFTVSVVGTGEYKLTYLREFIGVPVIQVTLGVATGRTALAATSKTQATVVILNSAGTGAATEFNFTAKLY